MGLVHKLEAMAEGGIDGLKAGYRDWSPFVAHFTSARAMRPVLSEIEARPTPSRVKTLLDKADRESFGVVEKIANAGILRPNSPASGIPACVCLSECTLPGLIPFSERYGRFGFVFEKRQIYRMGGRPCLYLAKEDAAILKGIAGEGRPGGMERIRGLSNIYTPAGHGKVQDYTHDREWRVFGEIDLVTTTPVAILAPTQKLAEEMRDTLGLEVLALPSKVLYRWGI